MDDEGNKSNQDDRGLASADEETKQEVSSKGGKASGGNFKNDPERQRGRENRRFPLSFTS